MSERPHDLPLDQRGLPEGYPFDPRWEVTPRQAKAAVERDDDAAVLLDCREPAEVRVAWVRGAKHIPMQQVPGRLDELEDARDKSVIVLCHHGARSLRVTAFLRKQGFKRARSVAGGIDLWSRVVDPQVPRY